MPIPFLFLGLGAAAIGVGKTVKAGIDQKDANNANEQAKSIINKAKAEVDTARKNSGDALTRLGERKIAILDNMVKPFAASVEKIHDIEWTGSAGMDELQKFRLDEQSLVQLKKMQEMAASVAGGVASGAAIGAVTAFGAYSAVSLLGTASTGTLISALSGVAASNATLAFLGGGTLAAGGLGIAGGTAVLGGLFAGPALAVMGFIVGGKASANKERAYSNLAEARKFREEAETAKSACKAIRLRAEMFSRMILKLGAVFDPLVYSLEQIIATSGTDYANYSDGQKATIAAAMSMAGAIKSVLDTPILNEDGSLAPEALKTAESVNKLLAASNA